MLTPEQEKQRALKISQLYYEPSKTLNDPTVEVPYSFDSRFSFKLSLLFVLPLIITNIVFSFYFDMTYLSPSDIQAASIVFIMALMVIGVVLYQSAKYFYNQLSLRYQSYKAIFWATTFLLLPLLLFVRFLLAGMLPQSIPELIVRCVVFSLIASIVAVVGIGYISNVFEKTVRKG
jgi:hypothetical protein